MATQTAFSGRRAATSTTIANATTAEVEGSGHVRVDGAQAHAEGTNHTVSGAQAHAEGTGNTASGAQSHAEGSGTTASGAQAHVEGDLSIASGAVSHVWKCSPRTCIG